MYCPNCDLHVETEVVRGADPEKYVIDMGEMGHALGHGWFELDDVETTSVDGEEYGPTDVGRMEDAYFDVRLRVDICANCAVPIRARTYTVIA